VGYPAYESITIYLSIRLGASQLCDKYLYGSSLKEYWQKRHQNSGKRYWERNSRNYNIAKNQNWKCPTCGEALFNGEEIETHHIVPVAQDGRNDIKNLQHLHKACHKQEHSKNQVKPLEVRLEPDECESLLSGS
jgi:HNH endonuclease